MPPRQDPVPRARAAFQWLSGLLLLGFLAAGVVAAAAALWENVDVQSLARRAAAVTDAPLPAPPEGAGPVAFGSAAPGVALYESAASAGYFPDSAFYRSAIADWKRIAEASVGPVRTVRGPDGVAGLAEGSLLVAPEAVCLSRSELAAFRRHLSRGGGLVINWAIGARDESCGWRGWEPLRELAGALDLAELPADQALFLTVPAALPVSPGLPAGARIELFPEPHLALQVPGPRAYWSDWALNAPGGPTPGPDAAVALHEPDSGGRVAWFGFRLRQAATDRDARRLRQVVENGVRWAAGQVAVEVATWPEGRRGGLLVAEDVETGFENAGALAAILRGRGATGTFFAVSRMALEHPGLGETLAAAGEVGSQTADHASTAGLPLDEQEVRLARSVTELQNWAGVAVTGLRPPEERFDAATLQAWARAGGRYVAAVNDARSAAPEVYPTPDGPVTLLPRLIKDDYNVFVQEGARRTERLRTAWIEGLDKIEALGGLAYFSLHSQIAGTPDRVEVVGELLDTARARPAGWWVSSGDRISRWWLARAASRLELDEDADSLVVRLLVPDGGLDAPWLEVYAPARRDLRPFRQGRALPWAPTPWGIRFPAGGPTTDPTDEIVLRPATADAESHVPDVGPEGDARD